MAQNEFPGLPDNIYEYENQFNYAVWSAGTVIQCCNVPWDSSYRDIVRFDSDTVRDEYFSSLTNEARTIEISGMVYLRYNEPIRVNIPFERINNCNYIIVRNPWQPVPQAYNYQTTYYYFITDCTYVAPNTTQLNVQLDVWQTFGHRVQFNYCYVVRGHIGIANENSTTENLADYLTDPEGLNIGDEYEIVNQEFIDFTDDSPWIVVMSTTDLEGDWGNKDNPTLNTSKGGSNYGLPNGCRAYALKGAYFMQLMTQLSKAPWVSQGVNLITAVPQPFVATASDSTELGNGIPAYRIVTGYDNSEVYWFVNDWLSKFRIPSRYTNLHKLYCSPYCAIEMTGLNGGEIVLKPECIKDESGNMKIVAKSVCAPPDIRTYVYPDRYNEASSIDTSETHGFMPPVVTIGGDLPISTIDGGENFDMALQFTNWPQFALVNNMYLNYMASTVNTRNYAFNNADWSQQKAMMAAQTAYNQSTNNMNTALENLASSNNANQALSLIAREQNLWNGVQTGVGSLTTGGMNAASGALSSGNAAVAATSAAVGMASGLMNAGGALINTALNDNWLRQQNAIQIGAATTIGTNNVANQGYTRDTNYDYARFAAQGDYELAIQSIQSKVQDAKLTQPTTSGQNGGDAFNLANGYCGILFKWKRLKPNFMRQVGDFFLRYGYYVNRWIFPPVNLKCCENFTYWQMQHVGLTGYVPEVFKQTIRGIFEKGVTVWNDPNKMYKIDVADNDPIQGVRY